MPHTPPEPILKVERLSYRYPSGHAALRDVSFSIAMGERVGLVGPNGAGKTTLLLHLNGLLPGDGGPQASFEDEPFPANDAASREAGRNGTPHSGRPHHAVEVLGLPVLAHNLTEVRRVVGFLFQNPDDQLFCPTVRDDVAFGPLNLGFPRDEVLRRIAVALEAVGLAGFEARSTQELSFGERRRVCLAGVLACDPSLLALDEPSSNLDPRARRQFLKILRECDAAQIIASHDLELILELCSRVLVLDHGRLQADGPPDKVFGDERLMQAHGLEVPLSIQFGPRN